MNEALTDFLVNLKNNPKVKNYDEAATKQAIILPLLQLLGWDTHNIEEVTPEFSVESRRVDYSLRSKNENEVFLEVKKAGEDLERYEEQLLDYSFRQGVELAVLTNGVTFWFYLPKQRGDWKARKFYTIDVIEQEIHDVTQKFGDLLSKVNILAGNALQAAENIYKGKLRKKVLEETLPAAWDRLISEPNTLLLDQLSETVEKLCGFKPEANEVTRFLRQHETEFLLLSEKSTFQRPMKIVTTRNTEPNKFSSKLFGETGDKKNTYSHVEVLDYVNYYGLIEAKQIMFCTRRSGQHRLVLWCKSTRSSKYELSEEGKRYEQSLPIFRNSSYIADVECISFNNNNLNMWK